MSMKVESMRIVFYSDYKVNNVQLDQLTKLTKDIIDFTFMDANEFSHSKPAILSDKRIIICRLEFPTARAGDNLVPVFQKIVNDFGKDRALLLIMRNYWDGSGNVLSSTETKLFKDRFAQLPYDLTDGMRFTDLESSKKVFREIIQNCCSANKKSAEGNPGVVPVLSIEEKKKESVIQRKFIFCVDDKRDKDLISQICNVPFEILDRAEFLGTKEVLQKNSETMICHVAFPTARLSDSLKPNFQQIVKDFGRERALLMILRNEFEATTLVHSDTEAQLGEYKDCVVQLAYNFSRKMVDLPNAQHKLGELVKKITSKKE